MNIYLVGGMVRDHLLGLPRTSTDYDFAVEAPSFEAMREDFMDRQGYIWQERPEFVTLRGRIALPVGSFGGLVQSPQAGAKSVFVSADFTLCRAEAQYSDRRHPDTVTPAPLITDLGRRDFTINAAAMTEDGTLIDPYDGQGSARARALFCVGLTEERMREDPLRLLRALRFMVKYRLSPSFHLSRAMNDHSLLALLGTLPVERVREELGKALQADWYETMRELMVRSPCMGRMLHSLFPRLGVTVSLKQNAVSLSGLSEGESQSLPS